MIMYCNVEVFHMVAQPENLKIKSWRLPLSEEMASSCGTLDNILHDMVSGAGVAGSLSLL